jgi:hypothetical protein
MDAESKDQERLDFPTRKAADTTFQRLLINPDECLPLTENIFRNPTNAKNPLRVRLAALGKT